MKNHSLKSLVWEYLAAINGKEKTEAIIEKYVSDPKLKEHILMFEMGFPKYELVPEDMIEEGRKVAVRMVFRGVHQNIFMEIPPTGKKISLPLMIIYEFQNGKISQSWMSFDMLTFMEKLGVMEPA